MTPRRAGSCRGCVVKRQREQLLVLPALLERQLPAATAASARSTVRSTWAIPFDRSWTCQQPVSEPGWREHHPARRMIMHV